MVARLIPAVLQGRGAGTLPAVAHPQMAVCTDLLLTSALISTRQVSHAVCRSRPGDPAHAAFAEAAKRQRMAYHTT